MIQNVLPVMGDLDRTEEFYHRLLGLESTIGDPRARLAWYVSNALFPRIDMYARQGKHAQFFSAARRELGANLRKPRNRSTAPRAKRLDTHIQDPGAMQFIFDTRDVNQLTAWITKGGAKVHSVGGKLRLAYQRSLRDGDSGGARDRVRRFQRVLRATRPAR